MRFVIAKRRGVRGEGLGNELFAWAKGWIASEVLNAKLVGPSWGINSRAYHRNFQTSRWDVLWEELGSHLPHHSFTEDDYRQCGHTDFGKAISVWAERKGILMQSLCIVTVDGMYGGYPAIASARDFLMSELLRSRNALHNMICMKSRLSRNKLFVAVHMRSGPDFTEPHVSSVIRGQFNVRVPGDWYIWVCSRLEATFKNNVQFLFFTDHESTSYQAAVLRFNPGQPCCSGLTECSDLLLMSQADLRVCSVSSYSLAACFLSGGPYVWYEPQLDKRDQVYSLWSHEKAQQQEESLSNQSHRFVKSLGDYARDSHTPVHLGTAMAIGDPLPLDLEHCLKERLRCIDSRTNLIEYGALPTTHHETPC